jgi:hypothetical protein
LIAVVWAALVLVRTAATGFEFNGGAYGNGQKLAVVLAILVLVVGDPRAPEEPPVRRLRGG